jgi:multidrug transporter EmrE-like cation transporter
MFHMSEIYVIIYYLKKPHERPKQRMELFNEVIFMVVTYHFICFSDFNLSLVRRFQMGYSLFGVTGIFIVVHFGTIFGNHDLKHSKTTP